MSTDRVLIPFLHVTRDAKCFLPCVYSFFSSKTIRQLYSITKMPTFGLYEYKLEGRPAMGLIKNGASLRLIHNLS